MRSRTACGGIAACARSPRNFSPGRWPVPRRQGPVLDAGCGTGGMLLKLGPAVAGRPTLGLEYDAIAAGLAAAKAGRPVAAGSVNEMPLGDGTLGGLCLARRALPWRGRDRPVP